MFQPSVSAIIRYNHNNIHGNAYCGGSLPFTVKALKYISIAVTPCKGIILTHIK
jgi:hypothetical protein